VGTPAFPGAPRILPTLDAAQGSATEAHVAAVAAPAAVAQPAGPRGVQPKNPLTPGVSTTRTRAAPDTSTVPTTSGLRPPATRVWPSWVPTSAARPIVEARLRPAGRARSHAPVAPAAVVTARRTIWRVSDDPSDASNRPSCRAAQQKSVGHVSASPCWSAVSKHRERPGALGWP